MVKQLEKPIIIDNVLPKVENIEILKHLCIRHFQIQTEGLDHLEKDEQIFLNAFDNNFRHVGYAIELYDCRKNPPENYKIDPLFIWARMVYSHCIEKLNIPNFKRLFRIHWNYYTAGQQGRGHVDKPEDNFISILYNMHTTDGGTEILGNFYQDKISQAKIFKSNWTHRGIATKTDKSRASLNIVLELNE